MSEIENKVVDNYKLHIPMEWTKAKTVATCSECFKEREAYYANKKNKNINFGRITRDSEINLTGNPEFSR